MEEPLLVTRYKFCVTDYLIYTNYILVHSELKMMSKFWETTTVRMAWKTIEILVTNHDKRIYRDTMPGMLRNTTLYS